MTVLPPYVDIIVVGAGPVGALAALRFAARGYRVLVVEQRPQAAGVQDARALALSWGSYQYLNIQGLDADLTSAHRVDAVHVSQQGGMGRVLLHQTDLGIPHLGCVVEYTGLVKALTKRLTVAGITVAWASQCVALHTNSRYANVIVRSAVGDAEITCRLVVRADGSASCDSSPEIHQMVHDYQQCAVVARVAFEHPPGATAYERFTSKGPIALLPYQNHFVMVWSAAVRDAKQWQYADEMARVKQLQALLGERLGKINTIIEPSILPLFLKQANRVVSGRCVLVGNAAQTLHPIAAQGLNLGIRDAVVLTETIAKHLDPGDHKLLAKYRKQRYMDSQLTIGFTHGLVQLFEGHACLPKIGRGISLALLDSFPKFRREFAHRLVGGNRRIWVDNNAR